MPKAAPEVPQCASRVSQGSAPWAGGAFSTPPGAKVGAVARPLPCRQRELLDTDNTSAVNPTSSPSR